MKGIGFVPLQRQLSEHQRELVLTVTRSSDSHGCNPRGWKGSMQTTLILGVIKGTEIGSRTALRWRLPVGERCAHSWNPPYLNNLDLRDGGILLPMKLGAILPIDEPINPDEFEFGSIYESSRKLGECWPERHRKVLPLFKFELLIGNEEVATWFACRGDEYRALYLSMTELLNVLVIQLEPVAGDVDSPIVL